jgi:hypothetical protein
MGRACGMYQGQDFDVECIKDRVLMEKLLKMYFQEVG